MSTANPPAEQTAELMKNLSLESQTKPQEVTDANKKPGEVKASIPPSDRSVTPVLPAEFMDQTMCYYPSGYQPGYYYGGYEDWQPDYSSYDGLGIYGDNASLMYSGYGFPSYGAYSPAGSAPTMGNDGQLYVPQQYQYPTYYPQSTPPSGPYTPNQAPDAQGKNPSPVASDQASLPAEAANGNAKGSATGNSNGAMPLKASNLNTTLNSNDLSGKHVYSGGGFSNTLYQDPRSNFDGMRSQFPWIDVPGSADGQQRPATSNSFSSTYSRTNNVFPGRYDNGQPLSNLMHPRQTPGMGQTPGYMNRMYSNSRIYGQYGTTARTGGFVSNGYDYRNNGRGYFGADSKYKPKGRSNDFAYGNENMDGFNELSRGPRSRGFKSQKGDTPITIAVRGQNISPDVNSQDKVISVGQDGEQYNREEFPVNYSEAKFFIIKSYSEDDVHKSIKYSVWASTPNGNKKLDTGYQQAQEKSGGCPVFLFFSVNTSGQFVGLAEMVGPVDFNKSVEYWQQDKWTGCFSVKWHIVKDVPNNLLKHITLENNDNKPVTNSRDTQEVKFDQGIQMLKIFKDHSSKTCILDDFGFYESRQKTVQEKKAKHLQFQKQALDGKPTDAAIPSEKEKGDGEKEKEGSEKEKGDGEKEKEGSEKEKGDGEKESGSTYGQVKLESSAENDLALPNQAVSAQVNGEQKQSEESELVGDRDVLKSSKPTTVTEKKVVVNGVANGY